MIVWVNGCFDVLHIGHIRLFKYASELGNHLVVGIDSDERVRELKGECRPHNTQEFRKEMLMSLKYVDDVVIYDSEEHMIETIIAQKVELMVVGNDYRFKDVIGEESVQAIAFFKKISGHSTSNILNHKENING